MVSIRFGVVSQKNWVVLAAFDQFHLSLSARMKYHRRSVSRYKYLSKIDEHRNGMVMFSLWCTLEGGLLNCTNFQILYGEIIIIILYNVDNYLLIFDQINMYL